MVVGVCSGLSVCLAVPYVLVAGGNVECGVVVITDCKMESICTGATLLIGVVEGVVAGGSVSVVVPRVGVACILVERLVCAMIDSQI